jgi:hypothetical protein
VVAGFEREHFAFFEDELLRCAAFRTEVNRLIPHDTGAPSGFAGGDFRPLFRPHVRNFRVIRLPEEYLVLLEYYNVYSGDINRTASGIKNISKGLCGI